MNRLVKAYYQVRPFLPQRVRTHFRCGLVQCQRLLSKNVWPIDPRAALVRPPWKNWPEKKPFALILTHDVEDERGLENCQPLMALEEQLGFRSSFNFVAGKYPVPSSLREELTAKGFEVGVHGLFHDGKLYNSPSIFKERALRINRSIRDWGAVGFRSPSMQHNLAWLHDLDILYDASTFDTDPFEPDHSGVHTIFPFWVADPAPGRGYVELPYTLPQDSTLYLFLREKNIDIWTRKLAWVVRQRGMVLVNTHPDYMDFSAAGDRPRSYPVEFYRQFLEHILAEYPDQYWHALPHEMASFVVRHRCV